MAGPVSSTFFVNTAPRRISGPTSLMVDPSLPRTIGDMFVPNDGGAAYYWNGSLWVSAGSALTYFYFATYNGAASSSKYAGNGFVSSASLGIALPRPAIVTRMTIYVHTNTLNADARFAIYKDGVSTGQYIDFPQGSSGLTYGDVLAYFAQSAIVDLVVESTATAGTIRFSGNVMF